MPNAVENERNVTDRATPPMEKGSESRFQYFVIGIIVFGLLSLVAYQVMGCAGCYGASWIQ